MKWIDYKYVDFQSGKFDYSVCEKVPYTNQLDEHPHVPSHVLEKMKEIIPQDVQDAYLNNGYYIINDFLYNSALSWICTFRSTPFPLVIVIFNIFVF